MSTMPPEKKRKIASNRLGDNGERRLPEFVCKCEGSKSTHKYGIQCDRHRRLIIHENIAKR